MPKFDYRGRSADTTPTSGTIEAVDSFAARRQLEVSGLQVLRLTPEMAAQAADARAESLPALGSADALELAFQISELARSGLPLAAGLRAIEAELPMGRFSRATGKLAERLEAGARPTACWPPPPHACRPTSGGCWLAGSARADCPRCSENAWSSSNCSRMCGAGC